jgi:anti-sigma factor ChrR (cupin superfamily)
MRNAMRIGGLSAAVVASFLGGSLVRGAGEEKAKAPVILKADSLEFKEVEPGASMATLWGNTEKGPFGAFTRFKPGFKCGLHTHSSDLRIIVIEGAYVLATAVGEKRVVAGNYLYEPAGYEHSSSGDAKTGCLFYVEGNGKFDLKHEEKRP